MGAEALPRPAACPACIVPLPDGRVETAELAADIILSLPNIHCAACISAVERGLSAEPGVHAARVNLSLKRVSVLADATVTPDHLVASLAAIGHEAHELDPALLAEATESRENRDLLMRLAVSGFAMMNVMLLSVAVWAGAEAATRDMMHWVSAMIALPAIAFSAQPFFKNAWGALRTRHLNMDVPISLAIILAGGMSLYETTQSGAHAYFDAALSLTFFLLAGRYLDYRTRASARSAAQELAALETPRALRLEDGREEIVPVTDLAIDDIILIKPGTRVPIDGVVLTGESEVDRAFLTGESLPVYAGPGQSLVAGEINLTGPLRFQVVARAQDSALQKMVNLVALAENSRNRYTSLADRAAAIYAPGVHLLAAIALVVWLVISGDLRLSLNIAIAVLIITCPCALGLAVPAVTTAASGRLFRRGVLLKSATALERLAEIDTVVFDKTGTLTLGKPKLVAGDEVDQNTLGLAAALASSSTHPLAEALVQAARAINDPETPSLTDIREIPGHGIEGRLDGQIIRLGRASWVGAAESTATATYLKIGEAPAVGFNFTDEIRPGVQEVVRAFRAQGLDIHLISGDGKAPVEDIAAQLGIDNTRASTTPDEKLALVSGLAEAGKKVLMVGDGLNDTGALAMAHVSLSPSSAIDAARVASDIVVLGQDFTPLSECLKTARAARARIKENFALAALYNLIAVPFALLGFATPLMAALAMSTSSITVTLNAWRVR